MAALELSAASYWSEADAEYRGSGSSVSVLLLSLRLEPLNESLPSNDIHFIEVQGVSGLPLALPGQALSFLTLAVHAHHPAVPSQLVGEGGSGIRTTKGSNYELILLEFGKKGAPPASDYSVRDPSVSVGALEADNSPVWLLEFSQPAYAHQAHLEAKASSDSRSAQLCPLDPRQAISQQSMRQASEGPGEKEALRPTNREQQAKTLCCSLLIMQIVRFESRLSSHWTAVAVLSKIV
ncbi:hypothetical protein BKA64DRAFT_643024 [Cadophora sp. MPI-SDFR-AT-0126]|nr:hypothetical protein BKA64DRAFT_643024 [Leotiomycetes sp. MPI-SDFR-AT-0126]